MDTEKLWKSVLAELELSVSKAVFQTHFAATRLVSLENNVATVGMPNPMMRTMVESRYYSLVKSVIDHQTKANISVVFAVDRGGQKQPPVSAGPLFDNAPPAAAAEAVARRLHIRPDLTFDSFAVSSTNQIAYAAATAVARSPGTAYNPLFFHGGVGVGKTHLMHAVANDLLKRRAAPRVVYCMGEEFLNEIIEAIQTKSSRQFKQKYRGANLLMVDDVQFIAGKQTAQEEFFHTFNAVHREGGQIILTSDRPPGEISRLEDRLRSRFEGGLIVDIGQPDFELRAAIVNIKAQAMKLDIGPEASSLIAANATDAREIEGYLRRLTTELLTGAKEITAQMIEAVIRKKGGNPTVPGRPAKRVSPQEILESVAAFYELKASTIKGPKRDRPIARPRQLIMYLCKTELGLTLDDIGGLLGGRDHTTVMHGVETITREMVTNSRLREEIAGIKKGLWG